jgi:iron(III) transport system permease protein
MSSHPALLTKNSNATPRTLLALGALSLIALPILTTIYLALGAGLSIWPHLMSTVLPGSIRDTLLLMLGVGAVTLIAGTGCAWLITMYRFPGRDLLDRLLVLPLAMPTYITAYAYVELLDYSGPAQSAVRSLIGVTSPRDYWFPDIRSLGGAVFVMSAVLYPYVYLSARASFVQQSVCVLEVARTLGRSSVGAFWSIALPLARPALAAGVALALMETIGDLGAVQYLGVQTLSASIYATWQQRGSLGGAAQIAVLALAFIITLHVIENVSRGSGRTAATTGRVRPIPFAELKGSSGTFALIACLLPVLAGFVIPGFLLVEHAWRNLAEATTSAFWSAAWHSVLLSSLAAVACTALGLGLAFARRTTMTTSRAALSSADRFIAIAPRFASLGYAIPGTVLALGLLIPLAAFDNMFDAAMRQIFGISTGLLISGTLCVLVLAYTIRFLTVSIGALEASFDRLSPNLDAAARTLGETAASTLRRVHLPLLVAPLGAAGLLVFVDGMKELPATILLRPFNFDTLATHVYSYAALEQFDRAAPGALAIVLVGLIPVLLLHKTIAGVSR